MKCKRWFRIRIWRFDKKLENKNGRKIKIYMNARSDPRSGLAIFQGKNLRKRTSLV
jgi:hypothetical protein